MDIFSIAFPAFIEGWQLIIQPVVLGYLLLGVMLGLAIGVFPGLGGIAGLSLVLPFICLLYTSPSPRDGLLSRMPSSA